MITTEEKAKAYDEALERAKTLYENANGMILKKWVEQVFPELAESEDEKVRKEIVRFIRMEVEDEIVGNKWLAWLEKQKGNIGGISTNWGEEDERNLQGVIDEIEANKNQAPDCDLATYDRFLSWLKSLKNRVQPKQEWGEEDERNLQGVIDEIEANKNQAPDCDLATYDRFLSWLKSLKNRVQPKQEWGEEDEHRIKDTVYFLDTAKKHYASTEELDVCIAWLESLKGRVRPQWKPSDNELEC